MTRFKVLSTVLIVIAALFTVTESHAATTVNVSGRVYVAGHPVLNAAVNFYTDCEAYAEGAPSAGMLYSGDNLYAVDVPSGTYVVKITPEGDPRAITSWADAQTSCEQATVITVGNKNLTRDLNAAAGLTMTGTVKDSRGDSVAMGTVQFYRSCSASPTASGDFTGGTYTLAVPAGTYRVYIRPRAGSAITSWNDAASSCAESTKHSITTGSSLNLRLVAGTVVTGSVKLGAMTVSDVSLRFYASCQMWAQDNPTGMAVASNLYSVTLPRGNYKVLLEGQDTSNGVIKGWHSAATDCAGATTIAVSGKTMTLALSALAGRVITGHVRNDKSALLTTGGISFYRDCRAYADGSMTQYVPIRNDGTYTATLPAGQTFLAQIDDNAVVAARSLHNATTVCAQATPISTATGGTRDLVALSGTAVTGHVRTTNNVGIVNATVSFVPSCDVPGISASLSGGTYAMRLVPGTYYVRIHPSDGNAVPSWNGGTNSCQTSTAVVISGPTTVADLTVAAAYPIDGTVTTIPDGATLSRGTLNFYADCDAWSDGNFAASTDITDGTFSTELPKGTFVAQIYPNTAKALNGWHSARSYCEQAQAVSITGPATIALQTRAASVLTGAVSSSAGPVTDGSVNLAPSCADYADGRGVRSVRIADGRYRVGVTDGTWYALIQPQGSSKAAPSWNGGSTTCDTSVPVTVQGRTSVDLTAAAGVTVTGVVTSDGMRGSRGRVDFYPGDCATRPLQTTLVQNDGGFELGVAPGTYAVRVSQWRGTGSTLAWHSGQRTCATATRVLVGSSDVRIDLDTGISEFITGSVSSPAGSVSDGAAIFFGSCDDYTTSNNTAAVNTYRGAYQAWVPSGSYRVLLRPAGAAASWNGGAATCEESLPVVVSDRGTWDLTVSAGVSLSGSVATKDGPVRIAAVRFYQSCQAFDRDMLWASTSALRSRYSLRIVPGTYLVRIRPGDGTGAVTSWHSAQAACAYATPVTVSADGVVDLRLLAVGEIPVLPQPEPTISPTPPPVTPPPVTPEPLRQQTVKAPPAKVKKGAKVKLAKSTRQGQRISWRGSPRKVCSVRRHVLRAKKKGMCKLVATAPAVTGYAALNRTYRVRVKKR